MILNERRNGGRIHLREDLDNPESKPIGKQALAMMVNEDVDVEFTMYEAVVEFYDIVVFMSRPTPSSYWQCDKVRLTANIAERAEDTEVGAARADLAKSILKDVFAANPEPPEMRR